MNREPKIVLALPISDKGLLPGFVERCIVDKASLIAVVGEGCEQIEDEIDWLIVGDGSDDTRLIATSSPPGETLEETIQFAKMWRVNADGPTSVARI